MTVRDDTLILGWGNPGRLDDGLGPAFVEAIRELDLPEVEVSTDFQLQVEYASDVARHHRVVFVDADRRAAEPFRLERIDPSAHEASFSTHSVAPDAILALARRIFDAEPEAWLLGIRGYDFDEFGESLSGKARSNLEEALAYLRGGLEEGRLRAIRPEDSISRESS